MNTISTTLDSHAPASKAFTLTSLALLFAALVNHFERRKAIRHLDELDDRLLKDVGLTRFDVRVTRRHW